MTTLRRGPFSELIPLREAIDRIFAESFLRPADWLTIRWDGAPTAIDVFETPDHVELKAVLAGYSPEEVEITLTADMLTLKGDVRKEEERTEGEYLTREIRHEAFERSIRLPAGLNGKAAKATFENGVLTLVIPKVEQVQPTRVKIVPKPSATTVA